MADTDRTILVVDQNCVTSRHVKELLEFMDASHVVTAMPDNWRERLGRRRLEAMFVGPELSDESIDLLLHDLEALDPNVPIVMMRGNV